MLHVIFGHGGTFKCIYGAQLKCAARHRCDYLAPSFCCLCKQPSVFSGRSSGLSWACGVESCDPRSRRRPSLPVPARPRSQRLVRVGPSMCSLRTACTPPRSDAMRRPPPSHDSRPSSHSSVRRLGFLHSSIIFVFWLYVMFF